MIIGLLLPVKKKRILYYTGYANVLEITLVNQYCLPVLQVFGIFQELSQPYISKRMVQ
jgi:hypothetical protein